MNIIKRIEDIVRIATGQELEDDALMAIGGALVDYQKVLKDRNRLYKKTLEDIAYAGYGDLSIVAAETLGLTEVENNGS